MLEFNPQIFNAHMHLNGSVSVEYLKETALRNDCLAIFDKFISETDLWKKFGWIHQIIKKPKDIELATIDVVQHSTADMLEIRTTAKPMGEYNIDDYIQSFVQGLLAAKKDYPHKQARGLLSIDRTKHSLEDAKLMIDLAVKEKEASGMIVGIDLSGQYDKKRTLTGEDLRQALIYAFTKDIGLALHVGEIDSEDERKDFDIILKVIQNYKTQQNGKIYGKVRLGHAIYRTPDQDRIIKELKIPVEICPSCHQELKWWKQGEKHPVFLTLYQHRTQPVIAGTDDNILFNCHDKQEQSALDEIFIMPEKYSNLSVDEQNEILATKRKRYMF